MGSICQLVVLDPIIYRTEGQRSITEIQDRPKIEANWSDREILITEWDNNDNDGGADQVESVRF